MNAISVHNPWAWSLFHGKPVENRSWATHFTGELLVHATKKFDWPGYTWLLKHRELLDAEIPHPDNFTFGAIIGKVRMTDCVVTHPSPFFFGPYGHVYTDQLEFKTPIPFKGNQKFFDVPSELLKGILL